MVCEGRELIGMSSESLAHLTHDKCSIYFAMNEASKIGTHFDVYTLYLILKPAGGNYITKYTGVQ